MKTVTMLKGLVGVSSRCSPSSLLLRMKSPVVKLEFAIQSDNGTVGGGDTTAVRLVNSVVNCIGRGVSLVSPSFSACLLDKRILVFSVRRADGFIWLPVFQS